MEIYPGYQKIYSAFNGAGRDVYVSNSAYPDIKEIMDSFRSDYRMTEAYRSIISLNSDPAKGEGRNPGGDARTLKTPSTEVRYKVHNRSVLIDQVIIGNPTESINSALFSVRKTNIKWETDSSPIKYLSKNNQWKSKSGQAHYAAACGKFSDADEAGRLIGAHIIGGYEKEKYFIKEDVEKPGAEYSLFYIPKGAHKKPEHAEELASIIQQANKNQLTVNWLIHGEATHTFKNAVDILKSKPLADAGAQQMFPMETQVKGQRVYFSNPQNASKAHLEKLCKAAGMEFVGYNANNRDLMNFSTLTNVGRDLGKTVMNLKAKGALTAGSATLGVIGAGGADKVANNIITQFSSGNYIGTAAAVGAGALIAYGIYQKLSIVRAGIHCTLGKGNQKWYASDKELFAK